MKKLYLCCLVSLLITSANAQTLQPHADPITASATGTTNATSATLPATTGLTNYICGFSIRANATAAVTGNATVSGTVSGTMNFTQVVSVNSGLLSLLEMNFSVCLPAASANTAISVNSIAPGAGGVVSVSVWGFQIQ